MGHFTKKQLKTLGNDFVEKIDEDWFERAAETHLNTWQEKYSKHKNDKQARFDLQVNHDHSQEIEDVEGILERKLTYHEVDAFIYAFNKEVLKRFSLNVNQNADQ